MTTQFSQRCVLLPFWPEFAANGNLQDASFEDAVAPASKKARQYDLQPQQPVQPMPHLQPPLPASLSSPAALQEPTTTPKPEPKKYKQQREEDEDDLAMDSFRPLQPTDPPVLPLSEHQPAAAADLEASRSRSRTHSEVSETPTRKLLFLNHLHLNLIRRQGVLP